MYLVVGIALGLMLLLSPAGPALAREIPTQQADTRWRQLGRGNGGGTFTDFGDNGWMGRYSNGEVYTGDEDGPDELPWPPASPHKPLAAPATDPNRRFVRPEPGLRRPASRDRRRPRRGDRHRGTPLILHGQTCAVIAQRPCPGNRHWGTPPTRLRLQGDFSRATISALLRMG